MATIAKVFRRSIASISLGSMQPALRMGRLTSPGAARAFSTEKPKEEQQPAVEVPFTEEAFRKLQADFAELSKQLESEKEKSIELLDKYRRALAEVENTRVRLNKQIGDAKIYGVQNLCKDMLEIADILGQASKSVPTEAINDSNPHLKNLYEGLTMTQSSLLQVFKRHGLVPIDPIKEKFDPHVHEALYHVEHKTAPPNTIIEVTKLGYKLHDRCIRPALVGVSKG